MHKREEKKVKNEAGEEYPAGIKFCPVIVTVVPPKPGPEFGWIACKLGAIIILLTHLVC
jgi:hypothetical protein